MSKAGLYGHFGFKGRPHGGDFFVTVANEYDTRPGSIHDEIAAAIAARMRRLEGLIASAVELGHLSACDPVQGGFEIEALLVAGNHVYPLDSDPPGAGAGAGGHRPTAGGPSHPWGASLGRVHQPASTGR